jgi:hypothetical protein
VDTAQIRASGQYALPPETPCDKPERSDVSGDGLFSQRHYCRVADDLAELSPFRGKNFDLPTMWQALVHLVAKISNFRRFSNSAPSGVKETARLPRLLQALESDNPKGAFKIVGNSKKLPNVSRDT